MKETTKLHEYVFDLWEIHHLTFSQIAEQNLPSFLSLKRIRNIRSAGPSRLTSDHEKKIYSIFRMKFLELKDVQAATLYAFNNQPTVTVHINTVRYIIKKELIKKRSRKKETTNH